MDSLGLVSSYASAFPLLEINGCWALGQVWDYGDLTCSMLRPG